MVIPEQVIRDILKQQGHSDEWITTWLDMPNAAFGGVTPRRMCERGDGQMVITRLIALAQGNIGS